MTHSLTSLKVLRHFAAQLFVLCALILAVSGCASRNEPALGAPMPTASAVIPSAGFITFCVRHLQECVGSSETAAIVELSAQRRQELDAVQTEVNAAIRPRIDPSHVWDYSTDGYGDCNTYALEKRRALAALGWPISALLLTTALTERGESHLVLVARTNEGDLVLDNRTARPIEWNRLPYRWLSRQSPTNPAVWLAILPPAVAMAAAASGTHTATP